VVVNEAWAEGLSSSLRAGLGALRPEIQATLVILADQPALTPGLLRTLVDRYRATGAPLVVPFFQGRRGNPVLVDRRLFAEMQTIKGDRGARVLLARYQDALERVEIDDPAVVNDVDTPEEYERAKGLESAQ
jgi:molybdenum cofactor cytidylyltransferase